MISDADSAARNAFRVALLTPHAQETPLPLTGTQELDPGDILEVREMAEIIARAEQIVAAPRSSRVLLPASPPSSPYGASGRRGGDDRSPDSTDIFDALVRRRTDDTSGPATPAPSAVLTTLLGVGQPRLETQTPIPTAPTAPTPRAAPRAIAASSLVFTVPAVEEDAFYAPGGRVRSLADVTLDGYRPEPTLLVRAQARRKRFTWLMAAALLPVAVLAAIAVFGRPDAASAVRAPETIQVGTTTLATATLPARAPAVATPAARAGDGVVKAEGVKAAAVKAETTKPGSVPTFDVNSLPTANR
ncbi:MAG: hypothetical protein JWP97_1201 [Labilithrix sp.]|nr:hypothetical protein [Labilithrix sp.]